MGASGFLEGVVLRLGSFEVTGNVVITWMIMFLLATVSWLLTRRLNADPSTEPTTTQSALEGVVETMRDAIDAILPAHVDLVFPFIATLWIFILIANLTGLVPGLHAPTGELSVTAALAILVFLSVHWFGIRSEGVSRYLRHYLKPSPILLPFHLVSEISRTLALAIRLFGNVMSLEIAAVLVLMVAGFLAPVPLLMLHVVEAVIQAYLFGMLAMIYIAGGIQAQELRRKKEGNSI